MKAMALLSETAPAAAPPRGIFGPFVVLWSKRGYEIRRKECKCVFRLCVCMWERTYIAARELAFMVLTAPMGYVCMHSQEGDKNKHFFSPEASAAIPTHTKT